HLHRRKSPKPEEMAEVEPDAISETEHGPEPALRIPLIELNRLATGAAVFLVYTLVTGLFSMADLTALVIGLFYGLVFAPGAAERQPGTRRVAIAAAVSGVAAVALAIPLRNLADIKPEIARVIAIEQQTAKNYQAALEAFKK